MKSQTVKAWAVYEHGRLATGDTMLPLFRVKYEAELFACDIELDKGTVTVRKVRVTVEVVNQ